MKKYILLSTILALSACSSAESQAKNQVPSHQSDKEVASPMSEQGLDTMIVAGGCFWCVESDFEKVEGVFSAVSGYTGGRTKNPTYKEVSYTNTGHYEAVKITFDPSIVSYETLLDYYWTTVDPTDDDGQFCDKGDSYRTAIFARADQSEAAQASLGSIKQTKPFSKPIVTPVLPTAIFYDAEDYHQDYYKKNPLRYKYYRTSCGRDGRLKKLWGTKN